MYKTIVYFEDLQDGSRPYHPGDIFPREGLKVTKKRFAELAGTKNRRGIALIEKVEEPAAEEPAAE